MKGLLVHWDENVGILMETRKKKKLRQNVNNLNCFEKTAACI
jgi:hypothetical protein